MTGRVDNRLKELDITLPKPVTYIDGTVVPRTNIPTGTDNIVAASMGGKLLVGAGFTMVGNVLFPISEGGMRPNATWTIGLERNF